MNTIHTKEPLNEKALKQFIEKGAELEHIRWAKWQAYLFGKCTKHTINSKNATTGAWEDIETGNLVISRSLVEHWQRQIDTPYDQLSEHEKQMDREEAMSYLPLLVETLQSRDREILQEMYDNARVIPTDPTDKIYSDVATALLKELILMYAKSKNIELSDLKDRIQS